MALSSPYGLIEPIPQEAIEEGEILGKGSYGLVIRARLRPTHLNGREVAIKIFQTAVERDAFGVELRQLSRVDHPNIIKLLGVSTQPPNVYLVMEYAECGSLYKVLHQVKPPIQYHSGHALSWVHQCALGVQHLHGLQPTPLIHRDLKSPNLLLVDQGLTLKICDFGTACDKQTIMTNNKGSAAWMAPEVFEGNTYTEKCDIFSWGIILWEVLTRRLPFDEIGGNDLRVLWAIHSGKRPPPILDCPPPLEDLIERCWDKDTSVRPTIGTVVDEISFIQQFFPHPDSEPLIFPDDIQDDDTLPSASFGSAVTSLKSKSEVWRELNAPQHSTRAKSKMSEPVPELTIASSHEFPESFAPPTSSYANTFPHLPIELQVAVCSSDNISLPPNYILDCAKTVVDSGQRPQGYWTPPEEQELLDTSIPALPPINSQAFVNAPQELIRSSSFHHAPKYTWAEDDSGPIPSDIEVVRGPQSGEQSQIAHSPSGHFYNHLNSGAIFTQNGVDMEHPYPEGAPPRYPLSDYRPMVSSLSSPQLPMLRSRAFGGPGLHHSISQPTDLVSGPNSPSRFHPGGARRPGSLIGSMAEDQRSHRTASPQNRSPQSQRRPDLMWNQPWINPIGTVYHGPASEDDWRWQQRATGAHPSPIDGAAGVEAASMHSYRGEDGRWAPGGPSQAGARYGETGELYMSSGPPPIYSNATTADYPYGHGQYLTPGHAYGNNSFNRRRMGDGSKGPRPYSADAYKLFSVQEDLSGHTLGHGHSEYDASKPEGFKKGHRRSSSYGSGSDKYQSQLGPTGPDSGSHLRRSFSNMGIDSEQTGNGPSMYEDYLFGRDIFLDRAVEHLDPDLRPVAPQPNCPQSMKIYNDHRWLAAKYVDMEQEISELQRFKSDLEDRLGEPNPDHLQVGPNSKEGLTHDEVQKIIQLQSEKEALLQFQDKLSTQLQIIKKALHKEPTPPEQSPQPPVTPSSRCSEVNPPQTRPKGAATPNGEEPWVVVQTEDQPKQ